MQQRRKVRQGLENDRCMTRCCALSAKQQQQQLCLVDSWSCCGRPISGPVGLNLGLNLVYEAPFTRLRTITMTITRIVYLVIIMMIIIIIIILILKS